MFRVPMNPNRPTFDETFKVSFWRWMKSSAYERREWVRRRGSAAKVAERNQIARVQQWGNDHGMPGGKDHRGA